MAAECGNSLTAPRLPDCVAGARAPGRIRASADGGRSVVSVPLAASPVAGCGRAGQLPAAAGRHSPPRSAAARLAAWRAAVFALAAVLSLLLPGAGQAQTRAISIAEVDGNNLEVRTTTSGPSLQLSQSRTPPAASAFSVQSVSGGTTTTIAGTGTVTVQASAIYLTLSSAVPHGAIVTLSYTQPGTNPLQDTEGNNIASASGVWVDNATRPPPKLSRAFISKDDFTKLKLVFDENVAGTLRNNDFSVSKQPSGGMTATAPLGSTAPSINRREVTLTLASAVAATDTVKVSYTQPTTAINRIRSSPGSETASFSSQAVSVVNSRLPTYTGPGGLDSSIDAPPKTLVSLNTGLTFTDPDGDALTVTVDPPLRSNTPPFNDNTPSHNSRINRLFAFISGECVLQGLDVPDPFVSVVTVKATDPSGGSLEVTRRFITDWESGVCPEFKTAQVAGRTVTLTMERETQRRPVPSPFGVGVLGHGGGDGSHEDRGACDRRHGGHGNHGGRQEHDAHHARPVREGPRRPRGLADLHSERRPRPGHGPLRGQGNDGRRRPPRLRLGGGGGERA